MALKIMCLFLILVVAVYGTPVHYHYHYDNPGPYQNGPGQSGSAGIYPGQSSSSYENAQPGGGPGNGQGFPGQGGHGGYKDHGY